MQPPPPLKERWVTQRRFREETYDAHRCPWPRVPSGLGWRWAGSQPAPAPSLPLRVRFAQISSDHRGSSEKSSASIQGTIDKHPRKVLAALGWSRGRVDPGSIQNWVGRPCATPRRRVVLQNASRSIIVSPKIKKRGGRRCGCRGAVAVKRRRSPRKHATGRPSSSCKCSAVLIITRESSHYRRGC